jgi:hypothetical protein
MFVGCKTSFVGYIGCGYLRGGYTAAIVWRLNLFWQPRFDGCEDLYQTKIEVRR